MQDSPIATWFIGMSLAFALATVVCFVSNNLNGRIQHKAETISQEIALLHRTPLIFDGQPGDVPEFRNRILMPLALVGMTDAPFVHMSNAQAFIAVRWLTAFACFGVLWWFAVSVAGTTIPTAALGAAAMALFFVLSFNHPWEHPTEFPDAIVMILAAWAAVTRRVLPALAIAIIGAMNRESAAFVGVIWFFVTFPAGPRLLRLAQSALLTGASLVVATALRVLMRLPGSRVVNSVAENDVWRMFANAAAHPFLSWAMLLIASLTPIALLLIWYWDQGNPDGRHVAWSGILIGAGSLVIGSPVELRILTPCAAVLVCGLLLLAAGDTGDAAEHRTRPPARA